MQAFQRSSLDLRVAGRPRAPGGHNDPFADIAGGAKSPLESQNCTRFLNQPISTVLTPPLTLRLIEAGKPTQNAYIESFNGKFRDECLNEHWFRTLHEARDIVGRWRQDYNQGRPHSALEYPTPAEFSAGVGYSNALCG